MREVRVPRRKLLPWVLVASAAILLCCLPLIWEIARYFIGEMAVEYRYNQIKLGVDLSEARSRLGAGQADDGCPHTRDGPVVRGYRFYHWRMRNGQEIWVGLEKTRIVDKWRSHYSL
jgi:hypothetical protein